MSKTVVYCVGKKEKKIKPDIDVNTTEKTTYKIMLVKSYNTGAKYDVTRLTYVCLLICNVLSIQLTSLQTKLHK